MLDSLLAPVRSVTWLESAAAWQGSRTSVLIVIAFLIGTPIDALFSGNSQGYFWVWFALRLFSDLNALRPAERERTARCHFGDAYRRTPDAKPVATLGSEPGRGPTPAVFT